VTQERSTTFGTGQRVLAALALVATLTVTIACISSEMVYHRVAAGLGLAVIDDARMIAVLGLLTGLTVAATTNALWRGRTGFGASVAWLAAMATLAPFLYTAITLILPVHSSVPTGLLVAGVEISPWGLRCAFIAGVIGTLSLAAFAFGLRRAVAPAGVAHGAALGAAAGAWAGLGVFLFCPSGSEQHLLAGHASMVVLLTLVGAAVVPRWLRP
jgi:hypothetical protein